MGILEGGDDSKTGPLGLVRKRERLIMYLYTGRVVYSVYCLQGTYYWEGRLPIRCVMFVYSIPVHV